MALTLSEMRAEARSLFNEADPDNSHITNAQLNGWANEAVRNILLKTKDLPKKEYDITATTGDITVDSKTLTIEQAFIYNATTAKYEEIPIIDIGHLHNISTSWLSDTASDPSYLCRKNTFTYYLYPQPAATSPYYGQNIRTYGMQFPTAMSADTDSPNLPDNLHDIVPHFMAYRAFSQLSMPDRAGLELEYFRSQLKSQREISTLGSSQNSEWKNVEDDDV